MVQVSATISEKISVDNGGKKPKTTKFVYTVALMAAIGGLLFGYDTSVVSSAMLFVPEGMVLACYTPSLNLVVSVTVGGCAVFSLVGGYLSDAIGRRYTILLASALFTVGAGLLGGAQEKIMFLCGRIIVGSAIGLASMSAPAYIGEASPVHVRGMMLTSFQLLICLGLFMSSLLGGAFSYYKPVTVGWRLMVSFSGVPSLIQFIGFLFLPESPRWLATHGKEKEARTVLARMYGPESEEMVDSELCEIQKSHSDLLRDQKTLGGGPVILQMLKNAAVRKALIVGCSLQAFQQLCGINSVIYYTASIVKMSGIRNPTDAIWMSCLGTGTFFFGTFIPLFLADRVGRRKLLLQSVIGVIFSLCFLGVGFYMINKTAPELDGIWNGTVPENMTGDFSKCSRYNNCDDCVTMEDCGFCFRNSRNMSGNRYGQCLPAELGKTETSEVGPCSSDASIDVKSGSFTWAWNYCPSKFSWMPIAGLVIYLFFFSTGTHLHCDRASWVGEVVVHSFFISGYAPMPWVINAELYPYWARSTGIAYATAANWFLCVIISQTFLSLTEKITKFGTFFLYAGITVVAVIWFYFVLPETKDVAIEKVDMLFRKKGKVSVVDQRPR